MVAGEGDFPQILADKFLIIDILFRDGRQPDDRIHRGTDIVGHRGEEVRLRLIRRLRFFRGRLEPLVEMEQDH